MKILVIGNGGREHALCWKLKQSAKVTSIFCAPGNGGIASIAELVPLGVDQISDLIRFAQGEKIDLTVVGPENPLAAGMVDQFQAAGLKVFGPNQRAAIIEGSKAFAKDLMAKYQIPTAKYQVFTEKEAALDYLAHQTMPIVIKGDGLAAGKGVVVAHELSEAIAAVIDIFASGVHERLVIEEFLAGEELSLMAFVDGNTVVPMQVAQDHKPVYDGDLGPNTGGMGAYSPVPQIAQSIVDQAIETILKPTANAMVAEGRSFTGILYAGLIITDAGPKVIEFNARFGDPETQVVLPRLETDLVDVLLACVDHRLDTLSVSWNQKAVVAVVLASHGYPGSYQVGVPITGIESEAADDTMVFHAGTTMDAGTLVTAGGRILAVTSMDNDLRMARAGAYASIAKIGIHRAHYRTDIGAKA